jgi:hypothetical protein
LRFPKKQLQTSPAWLATSSKRCHTLLVVLANFPSEAIYFRAPNGAHSSAQAFKAKHGSVVKRKIDGQVQLITPIKRNCE